MSLSSMFSERANYLPGLNALARVGRFVAETSDSVGRLLAVAYTKEPQRPIVPSLGQRTHGRAAWEGKLRRSRIAIALAAVFVVSSVGFASAITTGLIYACV